MKRSKVALMKTTQQMKKSVDDQRWCGHAGHRRHRHWRQRRKRLHYYYHVLFCVFFFLFTCRWKWHCIDKKSMRANERASINQGVEWRGMRWGKNTNCEICIYRFLMCKPMKEYKLKITFFRLDMAFVRVRLVSVCVCVRLVHLKQTRIYI